MTDNQQEAAAGQAAQPELAIKKTYIKDISFETPMGVEAFTTQGQPQVNLQVTSKSKSLGEDTFEVVLSLTITAKVEEKVAYLVEVHQATLFVVKGFAEEQLKHILGAVCPNFIFPYAREAIDGIVVKGGFPPLALAPIDFDAVYRQSQQAQQSDTVN